MDNGVGRGGAPAGQRGRAWARDAFGAVGLAEGAVAQHLLVAGPRRLAVGPHNAFGDPVAQEEGRDVAALARRAGELAENGERAALVAPAAELAAARGVMRTLAAKRLGVVFHAIVDRHPGDALALADLGWGLLFASSVEDSLDLALIARRAAEDSGTPFLVAHERARLRHVEPVAAPDAALCEAFVGQPHARLRKSRDPAHPVHAKVGERAFAERVPFALGSAMRELESLTGRRHDALERAGGNDSPAMLVGLGVLGDVLLGEAERLRRLGQDVGAVKVTAFRPFPGPRVVRALLRALVISVLEETDEPLAGSNVLTREIKAAFADALTWAPDYPGIGRIPRVYSGVVGSGDHELEAHELDAVIRNMVEGEHGKRLFVLGGGADLGLSQAGEADESHAQAHFVMCGRLPDLASAEAAAELCSSVVASSLALRARGTVRPLPAEEGGGFAVELAAAKDRPRGVHRPARLRLLVLSDAAELNHGNPLSRLARGGTLAVPSAQRTAEGVWAEMPPYVKAIAFDRRARVVGYASDAASGGEPEGRWLHAAAFAGIALAALTAPSEASGSGPRLAIDPSLVAREVGETLRVLVPADGALAERGAAIARRAFEGHVEVPRATVERDEEAVRLGRRDARAGAV